MRLLNFLRFNVRKIGKLEWNEQFFFCRISYFHECFQIRFIHSGTHYWSCLYWKTNGIWPVATIIISIMLLNLSWILGRWEIHERGWQNVLYNEGKRNRERQPSEKKTGTWDNLVTNLAVYYTITINQKSFSLRRYSQNCILKRKKMPLNMLVCHISMHLSSIADALQPNFFRDEYFIIKTNLVMGCVSYLHLEPFLRL